METVVISVKNAITAYEKADDKGKNLLLNLIGKEVILTKITDRVKTFEDIITISEASGFITEDMRMILNYSGCDPSVINSQAQMKISLVARVLNQGWEPNWGDTNEAKWYPWFDMRAGVGFSRTSCDYWNTLTDASSRLCFKSRELAEYAGKTFLDIYKLLLK